MERIIKKVNIKYADDALDFVEKVFSEYHKSGSGKLERDIVIEIRAKKYYLPELELIMVNESDEIMGYVMFSRFPLSGKYEDEVLILSPVCVKTELQRQHISKELIEYGFERAREMGYKAVYEYWRHIKGSVRSREKRNIAVIKERQNDSRQHCRSSRHDTCSVIISSEIVKKIRVCHRI